MRLLTIGVPVFAGIVLCSGLEAAAEDSLVAAVAKTRRELEMLKIEQRLYWQVEYPRQLRELDTAIRLTQAETDALEDRVRHYRQYKASEASRPPGPFWHELQEAELALLAAELRLGNHMAERRDLRRSARDRCRLLELQIAAARAELAELERRRLPGPANSE